jgi:hypothetical protein
MMSWGEFRGARPELAEAGRALLYQFGVGLAFLSTVRKDGGPRLHPMCPIIVEDHLYAFIVPSPKRRDLLRDGRYAMHCFPPAENEDAFYITGRAEQRPDAELRERIARLFFQERGVEDPPAQAAHDQLFEFFVESCMLTRTKGHGDWEPQHTVWRIQKPAR